jgi:hypothetical protein
MFKHALVLSFLLAGSMSSYAESEIPAACEPAVQMVRICSGAVLAGEEAMHSPNMTQYRKDFDPEHTANVTRRSVEANGWDVTNQACVAQRMRWISVGIHAVIALNRVGIKSDTCLAAVDALTQSN